MISSCQKFFPSGSTGIVAFTIIYAIMMTLGAVLMVAALLMIRKCFIDKGLGDQVSPIRMVVHALAFLIYVLTYFISVILVGVNNESYATWAIDTIAGTFSYVCLFFVIWHLGSKTEGRTSSVNSSSTISEDDVQQDDEELFESFERKTKTQADSDNLEVDKVRYSEKMISQSPESENKNVLAESHKSSILNQS